MHVSRRSRTLALALALATALALTAAPAAQATGLTPQLFAWSEPAAALAHAVQWVRALWDFAPKTPSTREAPRVRTVRGNDGVGIDPNGQH